MNRRDLLGALAAGLLWPPADPRHRPRRARLPWTFRLDGRDRWTLAARDGRPVIGGAEIAVTLGGAGSVPLSALEGARRFRLSDPGGANAGWQVVGTAQGVEVSAQFLDGAPPRIVVTARGLEDERSLEEIRFFDTRTAEIPALRARPPLWINGFLSCDPCRVAALGTGTEAVSHWSLATLDGPSAHPTAFAFGVDDAGEGRFDCAGGHVVATSRFRGRAVGAVRPPAGATLSVQPTPGPLDVLARWAGGPLGPRPGIPAGWGAASAGGAAGGCVAGHGPRRPRRVARPAPTDRERLRRTVRHGSRRTPGAGPVVGGPRGWPGRALGAGSGCTAVRVPRGRCAVAGAGGAAAAELPPQGRLRGDRDRVGHWTGARGTRRRRWRFGGCGCIGGRLFLRRGHGLAAPPAGDCGGLGFNEHVTCGERGAVVDRSGIGSA